jgi:integral membrane protein
MVVYRPAARPNDRLEPQEACPMSLGVPASTATPAGRFRIVAFWEGVSFLVLLLIAMPLKYAFDLPLAVRIVGMAHGLLFIAYLITLALAAKSLAKGRVAQALLMSVVPGGTFWLEARLQEDEAAARGA